MTDLEKFESYNKKCTLLGIKPALKLGVSPDGKLIELYAIDFYSQNTIIIPDFVKYILCEYTNHVIPVSKIDELKLICKHDTSGSIRGIFSNLLIGTLDLSEFNFSDLDISSLFDSAKIDNLMLQYIDIFKPDNTSRMFIGSKINKGRLTIRANDSISLFEFLKWAEIKNTHIRFESKSDKIWISNMFNCFYQTRLENSTIDLSNCYINNKTEGINDCIFKQFKFRYNGRILGMKEIESQMVEITGRSR